MKNIIYILQRLSLILVGFVLSQNLSAADITTGLKLHYTFDAVASSTLTDDSGNGNAGELFGNMLTPVEGYSGMGVEGLLKADYIKLPADISTPLTSFTFAAWVKVSALKNAARFFDFGNGADATNDYLCFLLSQGDNGLMRLRYRPVSGTAYNVDATSKIPVGVWAHVALTFNWDGTNGNVKMYINGSQVGSGTMPFNLTMLGNTADNYIAYSRWAQDPNGLNGIIDEVRLYDRALTVDDVVMLSGLGELNHQFDNLTAQTLKSDGDLSNVTANLNLPATLGSNGVTVRWATTNAAAADTLGNVVQPAKYNAPARLTATLSQTVNGKVYTMSKSFNVIVLGVIPTPDEIAQWDFNPSAISVNSGVISVTDNLSGFVGTLKNDARIRTIGSTTQYNVLDLGNGTGYFDMGTEIGQAVYSLTDYTVSGFFRIDADYAYLNSNGNFYWTFSNSADIDTDKNGYMIGSLKAQSQSVASKYYNDGNQAAGANSNAATGAWHHITYVQQGNTGTVYIDGAQVAQNTAMTNLPAFTIPKEGITGTIANWLGRSNYKNDVYLRKTLLYDFRLLAVPLSASDINLDYLMVPSKLDELNNAYAENPDFIDNSLATEKDNLTLGDLSALTSNLSLPTQGSIDPTISIGWKSKHTLISSIGEVTRPDYYNYNDTLVATLIKNGQSVTKEFPATILMSEGSAFTSDLLVKYDFSQVSDSIVTDVAEKHFKGTAKNGAKIQSIGITTQYNVLQLGDSIGYFDLGQEIGKLMYKLNDFTLSSYFRVDTAYHQLGKNGNFLWTFSNAPNILTEAKGYIFYSLKNQGATISNTNWNTEQAVVLGDSAIKGSWHHVAYTQKDSVGTLYIDGYPMNSGTITKLPSNTLQESGSFGTPYNWLGRSCYLGDVFLRKTLVYDFRLYRVALTADQVMTTELNVGTTINALEVAYAEKGTGIPSISQSDYKVFSANKAINIIGLKGTEKVSVCDISGRQINVTNNSKIEVNSGVYVVRINNYASKIIVK